MTRILYLVAVKIPHQKGPAASKAAPAQRKAKKKAAKEGGIPLDTVRDTAEFGNLSEDGKEQYLTLHKGSRMIHRKVNDTDYWGQESLFTLLTSGQLEENKDVQGDTLLNNLFKMAKSDTVPKSRRSAWTGYMLAHLADPDNTFEQLTGKGTCAATVLAHDLLDDNPAEFTRIVTGLASKSGQVKLHNGDTLKRLKGTMPEYLSVTSPIPSTVQASFMDFARPDETYNLKTDTFSKEGDSGLYDAEIERLQEALRSEEYEYKKVGLADLQKTLERTDDSIPVALRWSEEKETKHSYHVVLVRGMDKDFVYYRNPWGDTGDDAKLKDAGREVFEDGWERLPRQSFFMRQDYAVVRKDRKELNSKNWSNPQPKFDPASVMGKSEVVAVEAAEVPEPEVTETAVETIEPKAPPVEVEVETEVAKPEVEPETAIEPAQPEPKPEPIKPQETPEPPEKESGILGSVFGWLIG